MLGPRNPDPPDADAYRWTKAHRNHKTYEQQHNAYPIIMRRERKPKDGRDLLLPPRYGEKHDD